MPCCKITHQVCQLTAQFCFQTEITITVMNRTLQRQLKLHRPCLLPLAKTVYCVCRLLDLIATFAPTSDLLVCLSLCVDVDHYHCDEESTAAGSSTESPNAQATTAGNVQDGDENAASPVISLGGKRSLSRLDDNLDSWKLMSCCCS